MYKCSQKWNVVDPKSQSNQEKRSVDNKLLLSDGVNLDELGEREGVVYLKLSNTPYTGKGFEFHENGQKALELTFKEGKRDGLVLQWHSNGQKKTEDWTTARNLLLAGGP